MSRFEQAPRDNQEQQRVINELINDHQEVLVETGIAEKALCGIFSLKSAQEAERPPLESCNFGVRILSAARGYETAVVTAEWGENYSVWRRGELRVNEDGTLESFEPDALTSDELIVLQGIVEDINEYTDPDDSTTIWGRGLRDSPEPEFL